ncbi:MAG: tetratricopeptide repeat protein [Heteroscytonema crispum UTEX LB 1556]
MQFSLKFIMFVTLSLMMVPQISFAQTQTNKPQEAVAIYRQAIKVDPKNYSAYVSLGEMLPIAQAVSTFRQLSKLYPKNDVPYQALGYVFARNGKLNEATTAYRQAVKINPTAFNYGQLGDILMQQKKTEEAIAVFRQAVTKEPNDYNYSSLAAALVKQGKFAEALAGCQQVITLRKGLYETCLITGVALYEKQGLPAVITAYRQFAADVKPKHMAELYVRLGNEILKRGDRKKDEAKNEAIATYQEALKIHPGDKDAQQALNYLQQ